MKDPKVGDCFVTPNLTTNYLAQLIQYQLDLSSRTEVNSRMSLRFQVARYIQQVGGEPNS